MLRNLNIIIIGWKKLWSYKFALESRNGVSALKEYQIEIEYSVKALIVDTDTFKVLNEMLVTYRAFWWHRIPGETFLFLITILTIIIWILSFIIYNL